jgi:hypothetical protein
MRTQPLKNLKTLEATVGTNKAKIFSYIDPELKEELETLAVIRNRSVSNLLETMARQEVERAKLTGEMPVLAVVSGKVQ